VENTAKIAVEPVGEVCRWFEVLSMAVRPKEDTE